MDNRLSGFGDLFIKSVRDNTLFVLEEIISGHMKGSIDKEMHERIQVMSVDDVNFLKDVVYRMVDLTMHNALFMFEENQEWKISNEAQGVSDLNSISDGLAGELYTTEGWIHGLSEYPPSKGL